MNYDTLSDRQIKDLYKKQIARDYLKACHEHSDDFLDYRLTKNGYNVEREMAPGLWFTQVICLKPGMSREEMVQELKNHP